MACATLQRAVHWATYALHACRVSVNYTGALFDSGGDRIVHVDVDHRRIDFLLKEVVKKSIDIDDLSAVTKNKRQSMQLVLLDRANDKVLLAPAVAFRLTALSSS